MTQPTKSIAVIGSGMATCGLIHALNKESYDIQIFEKARGTGGRMAHHKSPEGNLEFGAQFFTARTPELQALVAHWYQNNLITPLHNLPLIGNLSTPAWVPQDRFSALHRNLLKSHHLWFQHKVISTSVAAEKLNLQIENTLENSMLEKGPFDHVVITAPTPQAIHLLPPEHPFVTALSTVDYWPCWVMVAESNVTDGNQTPLIVESDPDIAWLQRYNRGHKSQWVIQMSHQWSFEHVEKTQAFVEEAIKFKLQGMGIFQHSAIGSSNIDTLRCHRWLYAKPKTILDKPYLYEKHISFAGDACLGGRVEDAFTSGYLLGKHLNTL